MKPSKLPSVTSMLFPRTVDDLFNHFWSGASSSVRLAPSVDVRETEDAFVITAELPGVDANDVELTVSSEALTMKGEKKTEIGSDDERGHITERIYGKFSRSFTFPVPVSPDEVIAEAKHGVLTVTVKKAESGQTRRIEIKSE